ncbi:hypothetical protein H4R20_002206 [Coemansia guatemalensis]|uniref:Vacuolar protein sorting-associated protein 51 homolog n=1 Tax=Coemansia guatemalensis TaxID=2761395 RepID=A0A9W8HY68_9FUNG|nr:hypothetical protein H4R20_002206 [Coemansia guatemalensis]
MAQKNERKQAREKLRAFYKISPSSSDNRRSTLPSTPSGLKQQTDATKERTAKRRTTNDIDGSGFDAKKYLKKLLESQGVAGLLQADNQLVREVRQIDGAMKTMVYENYSRFIRATQAIQQMKRDADHMDAEMAKLTQRVGAIAAKGTAVNDAFAQRREHIQRLSREHRALGGLQFLFALPTQLNRLIGAARFVEAAQLWSRSRPLLAHYRRLGLFEAVAEDGREIMASVEATVWERWNDPATGVAEGAECASLLVLLRPERAKELWREYLNIQSAKNRRLRQQALDLACQLPPVSSTEQFESRVEPDPSGAPLPAAAAAAARSAAAQTATGPHGVAEDGAQASSRIAQFNKAYLPAWSSLVIGFASQFLSPAGSGLLERTDSVETAAEAAEAETPAGRTRSLLEATTEGTVVGLLSPLADAAAAQRQAAGGDAVVGWQAMSATELAAAQQAFGEHVAEWAAEYEFIADNLLQQPDDPAAAGVVPFLQQLDALAAATAQHPILVRIGGLRDCVLRVAARWQRRLVDAALQGVVRDMLERLEYYFDPAADLIDVTCGAQSSAPPPPPPAPRGSGAAARHQRNLSVRSSASLASGDTPVPRAPSLTWSAGAPRDVAASPQSPLAAQTSARGRAHARAVSSAFEALGNAPPAAVGASGSRTLRSASGWSVRRSRTLSGVFGDSMTDVPCEEDADSTMRRGIPRRYRPWLVWSVSRSAPLHVLLAETEAWLIQQVLERVNPLLERVVQHHLDVEASQLLDEGRTATDPPSEQLMLPPPQTAAALRHSFVRALDEALDAWMSRSIPDAFLHAAMARPPPHGTRTSVEHRLAESPMAQLGVAAIADPVVSLLLARFAVDFGLTLAQSIYQLCEHSISILPDDGATPSRPPVHSSEDSATNLLTPTKDAAAAADQRLSSITAASAHRTDSLASGSRRATFAAHGRQNPVSLLTLRHADHAAGWHSAAERLVRNFVMTVGREISAEYLTVHPYANSHEKVSENGDDSHLPVSVSGVWLSICRWMRQVEDDTNALFHDPVFSATISALNKSRFSDGVHDDTVAAAATPTDSRHMSAPAGVGTVRKQQSSSALHQPAGGNAASALHAHILSNIDRLFAERVDVFPQSVSPLNSGRILFHLAMQIVKTAVESLRLRAPVLCTRRQYFQLLVDIAFVRSWMLRYAGVHPDFIAADGRHLPSSSSASASPTTVNERDARAVQNLIDDWVASAKACAIENDQLPDRSLVDKLVLNAWLHAYFNRDVCA